MTYDPTIYDWPITHCPPINQTFTGGQQPVAGGMTLGGALVDNPEPGGRGVLLTDFSPFAAELANLAASWTMTMLQSGVIFRVPIWDSVQLVPEADITGTAAATSQTTDDMFSTDSLVRWDPNVPVTTAAAKGDITIIADFSEIGRVIWPGHVVGFTYTDYHVAHKVVSIAYDPSNELTLTIWPPLRRAVVVDAPLRLRPMMTATCQNPEGVIAPFRSGRSVGFGSARFVEAIL